MKQLKPKHKILILIITALCPLFYFLSKPLIVQDPLYHQFVDTRMFWGIPNAQDVLSNIFFIWVGFLGLKIVLKDTVQKTVSWIIFFLSIILVAPGSAYYHWSPDNFTLLWDRLPMSMGFMALYIVLLSEHVSLRSEKFLPLAVFMGISSVLTWVITTDLRFYFWIQFSSFVTIPIILALFPSRYSHQNWYGITLLMYGLAKWAEVKDRAIYSMSNQLISGHTLKHILAAFGIAGLCWMIKIRTKKSPLESGASSIEFS